jgi:hypothetical protein
MFSRQHKNRRNRRKLGQSGDVVRSLGLAEVSRVGGKLRIRWGRPIVCTGIPIEITCAGNEPTGFTAVDRYTIDLSFDPPPQPGDMLSIPPDVPTVRGPYGSRTVFQENEFY